MKHDLGQNPIVRDINPNTGRLEGDDTGYRNVPGSPLEFENPDPLVVLESDLAYPLYAIGRTPRLSAPYTPNLRSPAQVLVREPVARGLREANALLRPYHRAIKVVDGWRGWWTQRDMWAALQKEVLRKEGLLRRHLPIFEEVLVGMKTDDLCSYCTVVEDESFETAKQELLQGPKSEELAQASTQLALPPQKVAQLHLTFLANQGRNNLKIDPDAVTAHGNGGAIDLWMVNTDTGRWVNLGVPYDYFPAPGTRMSPSVMDYFDLPEVDWKVYAEAVAADPTLQLYLQELGYSRVTPQVFREAQRERRLLYGVMKKCGSTYFSLDRERGEPWHFQLGNERGGNQANIPGLAGSGNACHAILQGHPLAVWSNSVGHKLAARDFGFYPPTSSL